MDREYDKVRQPRIHSDGSQTIPLCKLYDRDGGKLPLSRGELSWSPRAGMGFTLEFDGVCDASLALAVSRPVETSGVGRVVTSTPTLGWTGTLWNDGTIRAFDTDAEPTTEQSVSSLDHKASTRVTGQASWVVAELPIDNFFAFGSWGEPTCRHFTVGFDCHYWPELNQIQRLASNGTESIRGSGLLRLSDEPTVWIRSAGSTYKVEHGIFVLTDAPMPKSDEQFVGSYGHDFEEFLSFLYGQMARTYWTEWDYSDNRLRRVYYARKQAVFMPSRAEYSQPLPLGGTVEAFSFGKDVVAALPQAFREWQELRSGLITHYMAPIWLANSTFRDDRMALVSVALERFAQSLPELNRNALMRQEAFRGRSQERRIRRAMCATLSKLRADDVVNESEETLLKKRITNICQPTNADRLIQCFESLGLEVTDRERQAINERNMALHGHRSFPCNPSHEDLNRESHVFDTLRTLLHRSTLALMKYHGPYVDYSSRPASGNFEVKWTTPRPSNTNISD